MFYRSSKKIYLTYSNVIFYVLVENLYAVSTIISIFSVNLFIPKSQEIYILGGLPHELKNTNDAIDIFLLWN